MAILAVLDDLLFRAKLEAAAAQVGASLEIVTGASATTSLALKGGTSDGAKGAYALVIVDLTLSTADAVAVIRALQRAAPGVPLLGYYPHAQTDLRTQATEAGCTWVWPRSLFVQRLPEVLTGLLTQQTPDR